MNPGAEGSLSVSVYPTDPQITGRAFLAWSLLLLGHVELAVAHAEQALADARLLAHPPTLALVLQCRCTVAQFLDDRQGVGAHAEALLAASVERGFAFWSAMGKVFHGWAVARGGDVAAGTARIREAIVEHRATEAAIFSPYYRALLADAQLAGGLADEALGSVTQAFSQATATGERWLDAELLRRKGELLLATGGDQAEAETHLRHAIAVAREQQAKFWELRAASSLARLWQEQRRCGEARDLLVPVYGWFTEGFEMPDLREAKTLLDELASVAPVSLGVLQRSVGS
jgi:predicted ATPase